MASRLATHSPPLLSHETAGEFENPLAATADGAAAVVVDELGLEPQDPAADLDHVAAYRLPTEAEWEMAAKYTACANCKLEEPEGAKGDDKFKVCARCTRVSYCSATCQKEHWKRNHREQCKLAAEIEREKSGAGCAFQC